MELIYKKYSNDICNLNVSYIEPFNHEKSG